MHFTSVYIHLIASYVSRGLWLHFYFNFHSVFQLQNRGKTTVQFFPPLKFLFELGGINAKNLCKAGMRCFYNLV